MLKITSISGNIFEKEVDLRNVEHLKMSRIDLEKKRLRKKTDRGTDIGLVLEQETSLHNGDILTDGIKTIVVEQLPEKVISLRLKDNNSVEFLVLIGHIIGNRHRPIAIENEIIYFPIQADSEMQVFERLFIEISDKIELSITQKIFKPHLGANIHDHR